MRSLNIVVSVVLSALVLACGSSTPEPETPAESMEAEPSADAPPAAAAADAGAPKAE
jgi:hypothetical protein